MLHVLLVYPGTYHHWGQGVERTLRSRHHVVALNSGFLAMRQLRDPLERRRGFEPLLRETGTSVTDFDLAFFIVNHPRHHLSTEPFRREGVPTIEWMHDMHIYRHQWPRMVQLMRMYDQVFCDERDAVADLRKEGIDVEWMTFGADDFLFHPLEGEPREHDACFIGVRNPQRDALFGALGKDWKVWYGKRVKFAEANRVYNRSMASVNTFPADMARVPSITLRAIESIAAGCPLITHPMEGFQDLGLAPGTHFIPSKQDPVAIGEALAALKKDPDGRERMRRAALDVLLSRHTYRHRLRSIFERAGLGREADF